MPSRRALPVTSRNVPPSSTRTLKNSASAMEAKEKAEVERINRSLGLDLNLIQPVLLTTILVDGRLERPAWLFNVLS